ncbi:hypothetical protein Poly30_09430 [Planctomycetes bacterium Poly30]|uniref:DsrE/DsrF-like family protein n=1 Tax=Saltatorellus ferox TaxID=2528018 RepID=A0A518EMY7_9BACT|nr:hypothetical protein Poly30_09430 [Planctomycetes bacterium Poly30]
MTSDVATESRIQELEESLAELRGLLSELPEASPCTTQAAPGAPSQKEGLSLVVFSGDFDKQLSAFLLATSAAASGVPVTMFFSFWGTTALKKRTRLRGKNVLQAAFAAMLPKNANALRLSRMNMCGIGPRAMRFLMKKKNVASLPTLIETASVLGVRMIVCQMSMEILGLEVDEIQDGVEFGGAATCVQAAIKSSTSLFI